MRAELDVNVTRARQNAGKRNGVSGSLQDIVHEHEETQPDSPFPFLEVALKKAKDSPFVVIGIMISIAAIIVGAVMSLAVGFGIFLFNMNGTMHEVKAQQTVILEQLAKTQGDVENNGNVMRSYEAANGKRSEYQIGLMTRDQQRAMNEYDQSHPLPKMPEKQRIN